MIISLGLKAEKIINKFIDDKSQEGWLTLSRSMDVIHSLEISSEKFYIVGSRAVGLENRDSDLDFICEKKLKTRTSLDHLLMQKPVPVRFITIEMYGGWRPAGLFMIGNSKQRSIDVVFCPNHRLEEEKKRWSYILYYDLEGYNKVRLTPKSTNERVQAYVDYFRKIDRLIEEKNDIALT